MKSEGDGDPVVSLANASHFSVLSAASQSCTKKAFSVFWKTIGKRTLSKPDRCLFLFGNAFLIVTYFFATTYVFL